MLPLTPTGLVTLLGFNTTIIETAYSTWCANKKNWPRILDPFAYFFSLCTKTAHEKNQHHNHDKVIYSREVLNIPDRGTTFDNDAWRKLQQECSLPTHKPTPTPRGTTTSYANKPPTTTFTHPLGPKILQKYIPQLATDTNLQKFFSPDYLHRPQMPQKCSTYAQKIYPCACGQDYLCHNCRVILMREHHIRPRDDNTYELPITTLQQKAGQPLKG